MPLREYMTRFHFHMHKTKKFEFKKKTWLETQYIEYQGKRWYRKIVN